MVRQIKPARRIFSRRAFCYYCLKFRPEHVNDQCLFDCTYFTPVQCHRCDHVLDRGMYERDGYCKEHGSTTAKFWRKFAG